MVRARCLVAGLSHRQIAEEIHAACGEIAGTTWIRAYRLALGISLADVVAQLRAWYTIEGRPLPRFSETLLSSYESGQKRAGPEYLHYLCSVYRADPPDLGFPDQCFCGRSHRDCGPGRPAAHSFRRLPAALATQGRPAAAQRPCQPAAISEDRTMVPAGSVAPPAARPAAHTGVPGGSEAADAPDPREAEAEDDDDVLRRALLRMMTDVTTPVDGLFLGAVDRIRRRMDEALVSGSVSATMLDRWEETAAGYGRQYMTVPPVRLLCDVLLDFGDVRRMCEHRQPLEFSERLCRLAAQLAGLAGILLIDVGDQRLARSFFRTARTAADETADRHLRGWVTVREALVPLYYGNPGEACMLAHAGAGLAGRNPCVAGAMGPVLEARALTRAAAHRDSAVRSRVHSLLGHAHAALSALPEEERSDPAFGYTERQLLFHEGDALVALGAHQAAEKAFTRALRLYSPSEHLDRSLVSFGIARCRLAAGEPEEALRLSKAALLSVPREHRSQIMVRTARLLGDAVGRRCGDVSALHDYQEAVAGR